ncbi:MAG: type II toxin-antitoxin system RelE/ParE family toxin [Beijerinckiaceae bacterium]
MKWAVRTIGNVVDRELEALPGDMRRKPLRLTALIENGGPQCLSVKDAKHLEGKLWELRLIGRDGIARVIYVTITGQDVVLLRAFVKKTQNTQPGELEIARARAKSLD